MAGRKPKLTDVKKWEGNPGKRKLNTKELIPAKGMPAAKKEWERPADLMNQMGVLTEVDMAVLSMWNMIYARAADKVPILITAGKKIQTLRLFYWPKTKKRRKWLIEQSEPNRG